jgi:hypothetical protein
MEEGGREGKGEVFVGRGLGGGEKRVKMELVRFAEETFCRIKGGGTRILCSW